MRHLKSLLVTIGLIVSVAVFAITLPYSGLIGLGALVWFVIHQAMFGDVDWYDE